MELLLIRRYFQKGTNGTLYHKSNIQCYSIELPWQANRPQRSCIPEGRYQLHMRYSAKFRKHIQLEGIEGRSLILIHPANNALRELKGCIAPVTLLTGEGTGARSRNAFEQLKELVEKHLPTEPVFLTIQSMKNDSTTKGEISYP